MPAGEAILLWAWQRYSWMGKAVYKIRHMGKRCYNPDQFPPISEQSSHKLSPKRTRGYPRGDYVGSIATCAGCFIRKC
jgi:hypothetical protein